MGEHTYEPVEPPRDVAPETPLSGEWATPDVSNVIEVKVVAASLATLGSSMAAALLNALLGNSAMLGTLPPWLQFVLIAVAPPLLAFLLGYAKPSNRV